MRDNMIITMKHTLKDNKPLNEHIRPSREVSEETGFDKIFEKELAKREDDTNGQD